MEEICWFDQESVLKYPQAEFALTTFSLNSGAIHRLVGAINDRNCLPKGLLCKRLACRERLQEALIAISNYLKHQEYVDSLVWAHTGYVMVQYRILRLCGDFPRWWLYQLNGQETCGLPWLTNVRWKVNASRWNYHILNGKTSSFSSRTLHSNKSAMYELCFLSKTQ